MNGEYGRNSLVDGQEVELELDLEAVARTQAPVLISASPERALMLAQAIAGRLRGGDQSVRILACDKTDGRELGAAFSTPSILLLREVHALTPTGQSVLRQLMMRRPLDAPRVLSSSSVSLYERMKIGSFDPELFYCLNTVHIVRSEVLYD